MKFCTAFLAGLACWLGADPALAQTRHSTPLPAAVIKALRQAQVPHQGLSVLIAPLPTEPGEALRPRLAHHEQDAVHPASVMKLFTTYAGLQLLGPDFTWRNRIYVDGPIKDGVLQGNLIVRGSGDPKLVVERLQDLIGQIMAQGVREVRGNIVLDRSVFDVPPRKDPFDDEPLRPYNVSPDGALLNFKSIIYTFTPDPTTGRARVRSEPPLAGLAVPADVPLRSGPCQDWRSELKADFSQSLQTRFAGSYATACGERTWPVAYPFPDDYAPRVFQALWLQAGGQLTGQAVHGATPAKATLLLQARSLPLAEVVADINKFSNNVMAQQLFLTLSSELGAPGRFEASRLRLDQWWRQQFPRSARPRAGQWLGPVAQRAQHRPIADGAAAKGQPGRGGASLPQLAVHRGRGRHHGPPQRPPAQRSSDRQSLAQDRLLARCGLDRGLRARRQRPPVHPGRRAQPRQRPAGPTRAGRLAGVDGAGFATTQMICRATCRRSPKDPLITGTYPIALIGVEP